MLNLDHDAELKLALKMFIILLLMNFELSMFAC